MTYTLTSHIRGGGSGSRAWVAEITGSCPTYKYLRKFVKSDHHTSKSGRSGRIHFHIENAGIYEFRNVQPSTEEGSIGDLRNGFILVDQNLNVTEISKTKVDELLAPV